MRTTKLILQIFLLFCPQAPLYAQAKSCFIDLFDQESHGDAFRNRKAGDVAFFRLINPMKDADFDLRANAIRSSIYSLVPLVCDYSKQIVIDPQIKKYGADGLQGRFSCVYSGELAEWKYGMSNNVSEYWEGKCKKGEDQACISLCLRNKTEYCNR